VAHQNITSSEIVHTMRAEAQYSKMYNRFCQIIQKTETLLAMLQEILTLFKNRRQDSAIRRMIIRQRGVLRRLLSERTWMIASKTYADSLCRPAATQYMSRAEMNRAMSCNEIAKLLVKAESRQAQHFVQTLDSGGVSGGLRKILETHLEELRCVHGSFEISRTVPVIIRLPESMDIEDVIER